MNRLPLRKIDLLVLGEFIPFFIIGIVAFTLLMVAVTLFRDMMRYIADYGLSPAQVGVFFIYALPQTVAYTFPMAVLFAGLLSFGRLSDSNQITALRAGGVDFFRIVLPALIAVWFAVLLTFILSEKIAPQSTRAAKVYIQHALIERGISVEESNISFMDQDAGWLFAAASGEGNVFHKVKWWDFSRPGQITLYMADEGVWSDDRWEFRNATVINLSINGGKSADEIIGMDEEQLRNYSNGNVVRSLVTPALEMQIDRTPSDILAYEKLNPEEMSLQELRVFMSSPAMNNFTESYRRKLDSTYHLKIAAPFASIVFILLAAPLGLTPQRSSSTMGIGLSMLLVFAYYVLSTFSMKIAESGNISTMIAAWIPNIIFLLTGAFLIGRFYVRSG